jgi:hypothetical protein
MEGRRQVTEESSWKWEKTRDSCTVVLNNKCIIIIIIIITIIIIPKVWKKIGAPFFWAKDI